MRIKAKLLLTLLSMSLLLVLVGALAVNRQQVTATAGATKEAENVAHAMSFLLSGSDSSAKSNQETIAKLHELEGRDIVLLDTNQLILADAVESDIGRTFTEDPGDEVGATLKDGQVRTFVENSDDSPRPIKQIVVPAKDYSGRIIGAVVLEYTHLYDELMESTNLITRQIIWAVLMSVLIAMLIAIYVGRSIAEPLQQLTKVATQFASGKFNLPMPPPRKDEIGILANAFSNMVQMRRKAEEELSAARDNLELRVAERTLELENIHKQLVEASRRGGMAEIASNVLHNVGNVLNSANISTNLIVESVKNSRASGLARVVTLLEEHAHDLGEFITTDVRGKHVSAHLAQLSEQMLADQKVIGSELESLRRNIEHIKEIVAMQQSYATFGGAKEMIDVVTLVEDSLRMNEGALLRHRVKIIRELEAVPLMNLEKHKILQILVNLVRNAKYACDESMREDRRLTVRAANGNGSVKISVIDNGVGILPENMSRIFNHGFTTRKGGHGFGLHGGALAAKEMGGSLTAQSDGPGRGAVFTLELPTQLPS
jgi:signal transduction histidine kinase